MSNIPTNATSPGWWQRLIDQLAGGPPNLEKQDKRRSKPWFVRYNVTLVTLVSSVAIMVAPAIVNRMNSVPDPASIQTFEVRILQTFQGEPHLLVQLSDGSRRGMEWPVPISGGPGSFHSNVWSNDERQRLIGCMAKIRGTPLRWTINERFRVWELECPEKAIRINFERTKHDFEVWLSVGVAPGLVLFPVLSFFIFLIFLREKRGIL